MSLDAAVRRGVVAGYRFMPGANVVERCRPGVEGARGVRPDWPDGVGECGIGDEAMGVLSPSVGRSVRSASLSVSVSVPGRISFAIASALAWSASSHSMRGSV